MDRFQADIDDERRLADRQLRSMAGAPPEPEKKPRVIAIVGGNITGALTALLVAMMADRDQ